MTEFTITDGTVEYRHTKPRAEYESEIPALRLNFQVAEGADPEMVSAKVMLIAVNTVENALAGRLVTASHPVSIETPKDDTGSTVQRTGRGRRAVQTAETTVAQPASQSSEPNPLAELTEGSEVVSNTTELPQDDGLAALSGEPQKTTITEQDVEHKLQQLSAHLRAEFGEQGAVYLGNVRKILATMGVGGYKSLKPEQYEEFFEKLKPIFEMKKGV